MTATPRFRSFVYGGIALRLVEDPEVRAQDIASGIVTVRREEDGRVLVIDPGEHELPPLPGVPPPGDLYGARAFVEDVLGLGFDDRWLSLITDFVNRHRLFMRPGRMRADGS